MEIENKGNIFIDTTSPENVIEAYHKQFQKDFSVFLKCRAEEVVVGGRMVHTIIGRTDGYPSNKDYCYALQLLNLALKKMVAEVNIINTPKILIFFFLNFFFDSFINDMIWNYREWWKRRKWIDSTYPTSCQLHKK